MKRTRTWFLLLVALVVGGIVGRACHSVTPPERNASPLPKHAPPVPQNKPDEHESSRATLTEALPARESVVASEEGEQIRLFEYHGAVLAPDGGPIADARVFLARSSGHREALGAGSGGVIGKGLSNADGRFSFEAPRGQNLVLGAEADGYSSTYIDPAIPQQFLRLTLRPKSQILGCVVDDETGEPLTGVRIRRHLEEDIFSASDGTFRMDAVIGVATHLRIHHEGYVYHQDRIIVPTREPFELEIRLERGTMLELHVFDEFTGEPLPGVRAATYFYHDDIWAVSDEQGRLSFPVREGMEIELCFHKESYSMLWWMRTVQDVTRVQPGRVPMRAYAWLEGIVLDASGNPAGDHWLYATGLSEDEEWIGEDVLREMNLLGEALYQIGPNEEEPTSDAEGRFEVAVIPRESDVYLHCGNQEGSVKRGPFRLQRGQRTWVDITMVEGATIRGRVLYNGKPWNSGSIRCERRDGHFLAWGEIDQEGWYEIQLLATGKVCLSVAADLHPSSPETYEVDLQAGGDYRHDFVWEEELVPIRGTALGFDGFPAAGIGVVAKNIDGSTVIYQTKTEEDGTFELLVNPDLIYEVTAGRHPSSASVSGVSPGSEGLSLTLPPVAHARIRVIDEETGADLQVTLGTGTWSWRETGSGIFQTIHHPRWHDGAYVLPLPGVEDDSRVELLADFRERGYSLRDLIDVPVAYSPEEAPVFTLPLAKGFEVKLRIDDPSPMGLGLRRSHLFFLVHEEELGEIRGPYPQGSSEPNHRINGISMWLGRGTIVDQALDADDEGFAYLHALKPGRYSLLSFPGDIVFEPEEIDIPSKESHVHVRWRER